MRALGAEEGLTMVEALIAFAVTAILVPVVGAAFLLFTTVAPREEAAIATRNDLQQAAQWVMRDASSAQLFSTSANPGVSSSQQYGYFKWYDYGDQPYTTYTVTYYYSPTNLVRNVMVSDGGQSDVVIARNIAGYSDVVFSWYPNERYVGVALTSTADISGARQDAVLTATVSSALKPRAQSVAPAPALTPVPTPVPGAVAYYARAIPTVITGTYSSGTVTSLRNVDADYFVVNSSTGGPNKEVGWVVESEDIAEPATISRVDITFVAQVSSAQNIDQRLYVATAAGTFSTTADSAFTYDKANEDRTATFSIDSVTNPAALAYIQSSRKVVLKAASASTANFTHSTNQVYFVVNP